MLFVFLLAQVAQAQKADDCDEYEEIGRCPESQKTITEEEADEDDGAVVISEFSYLDLPGKDSAFIYRGILGYTFEVGFQIGAGLTGFHLDRPCAPYTDKSAGSCPPSGEPAETSDFAGPTAMLGWDLELVQGWFGFEITAMGTFPVTAGARGWVVEGGASPYFSFEAVSKDKVDLAITSGVKYIHADIDVDQYELETDEIMPTWGVMYQF